MADKKNKSGIVVFIIIIVLAVISSALGIASRQFDFSSSTPHRSDASPTIPHKNISIPFFNSKKDTTPHPKDKYIARLEITGTIEQANETYNQQWLIDTIKDLKDDTNNVGIILYIDSPGGGVYEADEAYLTLLDYKTSGKPIYAYMGPLAASGGYYISCAADKIYANRNTLTGSIGVIAGGSMDLTKLMENLGIKYTTVHAGKNKNMGNYNEPLSDEQREIFQSIADECYDQFTSIVAANRKMKKSDVVKLADGRVYTAHQAEQNGLIDRIDSWDNTVSEMKKTKFDNTDYEVVTYAYEQKQNFYSYLLGSMSAIKKAAASSSATALPEAVQEAITPKTPYPAYFYDQGRRY